MKPGAQRHGLNVALGVVLGVVIGLAIDNVVLGIGGSYLGAKALFDALTHTYHNELPPKSRLGKPRVYFEGNNNVIADCSVLGKVEIKGVNNVLVANEIGGGVSLPDDKNTVCDGNVVWTDTNANKALDPGETGAPITCGGGGGKQK